MLPMISNALKKHPEFTVHQIQNFEEVFRRHDVDADGMLNAWELSTVFQTLGDPKTIVQSTRLIESITDGKAKSLNFDDFIKMFRLTRTSQFRDDLQILNSLLIPRAPRIGPYVQQMSKHYENLENANRSTENVPTQNNDNSKKGFRLKKLEVRQESENPQVATDQNVFKKGNDNAEAKDDAEDEDAR